MIIIEYAGKLTLAVVTGIIIIVIMKSIYIKGYLDYGEYKFMAGVICGIAAHVITTWK